MSTTPYAEKRRATPEWLKGLRKNDRVAVFFGGDYGIVEPTLGIVKHVLPKVLAVFSPENEDTVMVSRTTGTAIRAWEDGKIRPLIPEWEFVITRNDLGSKLAELDEDAMTPIQVHGLIRALKELGL